MKRTKTEIKLLQGARDLFWKYGFRRVTVEEICAEAGVSKMSFYRYFENKLALAKEVLNQEIRESVDDYEAILSGNDSFVEKMERTIHLKLQHADRIGMEFLEDILMHGGKDFQAFLAKKRMETSGLVADFFRKAQENGDIRKDFKLELIPFLSENLTQLAANEQLAQLYDSPGELIKDLTTFFFYGVISHPKHP